ncbi:hypothetical protein [Bythopirellula polymerisocia]|uniref:Uncharacterized protein n=1 Tax=Bythopirellula polymerisocia TaxID=2528003 RepID=A0A5C6D1R4_9BACT|nr:hypothetical protein [Bythopirellula polymerisocia]TWU29701.1 hypothetical protein Pla144_04800 [Bythopirellula polymerisocia]
MSVDPMSQSKADLAEIIEHINLKDSPVGIDAQYTHAIIISYLQQIAATLDHLEGRLNEWENKSAGK